MNKSKANTEGFPSCDISPSGLMRAITLVETNPIADWLDNFIVYDSSAKTNVGVAKRDKDSNSPFWYLDTEKWLYPNYCEYCHNSGTKAVSLRRFVSLLSDLGKMKTPLGKVSFLLNP